MLLYSFKPAALINLRILPVSDLMIATASPGVLATTALPANNKRAGKSEAPPASVVKMRMALLGNHNRARSRPRWAKIWST